MRILMVVAIVGMLTACSSPETATVTATETATRTEVVVRTPEECVDALYGWRSISRTLTDLVGDAMATGTRLDTPGALDIADEIAAVGDRVSRTVRLSNTCLETQ